MSQIQIKNSFQLEFVACYSMHLENLHLQATGSKDSRQRDRYTQLIAFIKESPFELAYEKYLQIALADTESDCFTDSMLRKARRLASLDMDLPLPD